MKSLKAIGIGKGLRFLLGKFWGCLLALCILPQLRVIMLRILGAKIGQDSIVHDCRFINFYRGSFRNLRMGKECFVGHECLLDLAAPISLGDQVTLAQKVVIMTHMNVGYPDHPLQKLYPSSTEGVKIGSGSFVGVSTTILSGADIGRNCLVSAGAVVTGSLPDSVLAGGVPAKVIRPLEKEDKPKS